MNITKMQIVSVKADSALAIVEGTLDNRFPMGATIDALDVSLAYNGVIFGSMNMSALRIAASAASTLGPMTVALTVSDLTPYPRADADVASLLPAGHFQDWGGAGR